MTVVKKKFALCAPKQKLLPNTEEDTTKRTTLAKL